MIDIVPLKFEDDKLFLLDQTKLPNEEVWFEVETKEDVWDAIKKLKVRGAPAIGVAAAYGLYVSVLDYCPKAELGKAAGSNCEERKQTLIKHIEETAEYINSSRPTAVNLSWALKRVVAKVKEENSLHPELKGHELKDIMLSEAKAIHEEDIASCKAMGEYGLSLLKPGMGILTHCNAGTIATSKYGTCLAPLYLGHEKGYNFKVFSDETRPLLQGARLTSWELHKSGIDVTLICDNMASIVMKQGWVQACFVGCDRIAANGDFANKIGTSGVAILAKHYGIPFYVCAPSSTIDMTVASGDDIHIEQRKPEEVTEMWYEKRMAPEGVGVVNPSFDVTDHEFVTGIITEKGIATAPFKESFEKMGIKPVEKFVDKK